MEITRIEIRPMRDEGNLKAFCSVVFDDVFIVHSVKIIQGKNSLFVGNARGGRTAAILASLTSTCRRHDVDPQLYLTQLLINLPRVCIRDLPEWLPDQWKRNRISRPDSLPK